MKRAATLPRRAGEADAKHGHNAQSSSFRNTTLAKPGPIVEQDVWNIADAMFQKGEMPTQRDVRQALGNRGSFTTLSAYLRSWAVARSGAFREKTSGAEDPELMDLARRFINLARKNALESVRTELAADRAKLAEREAEIAGELKAAELLRTEAEGRAAELRASAERVEAELRTLRDTHAGVLRTVAMHEQADVQRDQELADTKAEARRRAERIEAVESELRAAVRDAVAAKEETGRLRAELAAARTALDHATSHNAAVVETVAEQKAAIDELGAQLKNANESLEQERAQLTRLADAMERIEARPASPAQRPARRPPGKRKR